MFGYMKHGATGDIRKAPTGFSWAVLFSGFFVPLFRSDYKWAAIMLGATLASGGLANILFAFLYNGLYRDVLAGRGYRPMQEDWSAQRQSMILDVSVQADNGYDPFAARAAQAFARDPAPAPVSAPAPAMSHAPLTIDRHSAPQPRPTPRASFGRKGL